MSIRKKAIKSISKHVAKKMKPLVNANNSAHYSAAANDDLNNNLSSNFDFATGNAANDLTNDHDNLSSNFDNDWDDNLNGSFNTDRSHNDVKEVYKNCDVTKYIYLNQSQANMHSMPVMSQHDNHVTHSGPVSLMYKTRNHQMKHNLQNVSDNIKHHLKIMKKSKAKQAFKSVKSKGNTYKTIANREHMQLGSIKKELHMAKTQMNQYKNKMDSYSNIASMRGEALGFMKGTLNHVFANNSQQENYTQNDLKDAQSQRDSAIAGSKSTARDNDAYRSYLINNGEYPDFEKYKSRNNSKEQINERFHKVYRNNNAKSKPASGRSLNSTYEKQRDQKRRNDLKSSKSDQYQK